MGEGLRLLPSGGSVTGPATAEASAMSPAPGRWMGEEAGGRPDFVFF